MGFAQRVELQRDQGGKKGDEMRMKGGDERKIERNSKYII